MTSTTNRQTSLALGVAFSAILCVAHCTASEPRPGRVSGLRFMHDGKIVSSNYDGTVRQWDSRSGDEKRLFHGREVIYDQDANDIGDIVVSGPKAVTLACVKSNCEHSLRLTARSEDSPLRVAVGPTGRRIVGGYVGDDLSLAVWKSPFHEPNGRIVIGPSEVELDGSKYTTNIARVLFGLDDSIIIAAVIGQGVMVYDVDSGGIKALLQPLQRDVVDVCLARGTRRLIVVASSGVVRGYDAGKWTNEWEQRYKGDYVSCAANDASSVFALAGADGIIRVIESSGGKEIATIDTKAKRISAIAISEDGTQVAIGDRDGSVTLWSVENGQRIWQGGAK